MSRKLSPGPWFPIHERLLEYEAFKKLTDTEKLTFWVLVSEFNRIGGSFYRADVDLAAELRLSVIKVRFARRKIRDACLIDFIPGFRAGNRGIATTYTRVFGSHYDSVSGSFSGMHRHAFNALLAMMRSRTLSQAEVVMYVYLWHLWESRTWSLGKDNLVLGKRWLREYSGIPRAPELVVAVHEKVTFSSGSRLFALEDRYHDLKISDWTTFADPHENENNRKLALSYQAEIHEIGKRMRLPKKKVIPKRTGR